MVLEMGEMGEMGEVGEVGEVGSSLNSSAKLAGRVSR